MNVTELISGASDASYIHMERYVNDGSPTGFTEVHKTSEGTNPFTGVERFPLLEFEDSDLETVLLGEDQPYLRGAVNFAHPDSISSRVLDAAKRVPRESNVIVSPVSGGRTMILRDGAVGSGYLKLTYDVSRIGRVDRQLTLNHCVSSLEVSRALKQATDAGRLAARTGFLLESAARVTLLPLTDGVYEWGTIFRERFPYPRPQLPYSLVPGFSLFGRDRTNPADKPLIVQMIEQGGYDPQNYLLDVVTMIVDCYWSIVHACAMHIECHAQNCLFEVTPDLRIARIIVKDMDSIEKDLPLARYLGIEQRWESYPYMCMTEDLYYYPIRASYMYDFKLGEYLLSPLIAHVSADFGLDVGEFDRQIRDYVQQRHLSGLPPTYFPEDGCWYDCDNTERMPGVGRRQYFPHPNPRFR